MPSNIQVTKKALAYAVKHNLPAVKVSLINPFWGTGKRQLAWRVSGHLHKHGKNVPLSTRKTDQLVAALFPNLLPPLHILHPNYAWNGAPVYRNGKPGGIVYHHEDADDGNPSDGLSDVQEVHRYHKSLGWRGIAYHLIVCFDGDVIAGRPLDTMGAHTYAHGDWIGVAFEGKYERTGAVMPAAQLKAGQAVHAFLHEEYGNIPDRKHKDMPQNSTACPGKEFPFAKITDS